MIQKSAGRMAHDRHPTRHSRLGMVLLLGIAGGCGASDPWNRQAISGVITLDGQPLGEGAILLEPMAKDGSGMAVGATIRRGSFAIARERGPSPGPYRLRIYSSAGVQHPPGKGQSEQTRRPMAERLPEIYNTRSELRMDVHSGRANRLELDLHGGSGS